MKRLAALCSILALLGACANAPTRPQDDPCLLKPQPDGSGIILAEPLFLPVYFLYGFTCQGIRAMDRHGLFDAPPKGTLENGIYTAADHSFSVAAPPGLGIHEESYPSLDYVLFAPRLTRGPVYAVNVNPELEPIYASLTLDQFAAFSLKDARFQAQLAAGTPLKEMRREATDVNGLPALSIVYSQTAAGATAPSAYYLLYFMKSKHRSAVLSVAWPGDCPKCASGPDAQMRAMDPALKAFLDSFVLGGSSEDYR